MIHVGAICLRLLEVTVDPTRSLVCKAAEVIVSTLSSLHYLHLLEVLHLIQLMSQLNNMLLLLRHEGILLSQHFLQALDLVQCVLVFILCLFSLIFDFLYSIHSNLELLHKLLILEDCLFLLLDDFFDLAFHVPLCSADKFGFMFFALFHLFSQFLHPLVDGFDSVLILLQHVLMLGRFCLPDDFSFFRRRVKTCLGSLILLAQALILDLAEFQIQMVTVVELSQEIIELVSLKEDRIVLWILLRQILELLLQAIESARELVDPFSLDLLDAMQLCSK